MAPVERGLQRLVPGRGRPARVAHHADVLVEAVDDLRQAEDVDPCRGQLDGEREAVEPLAAPGDIGGGRRRQLELWGDGSRPLDEERDRLRRAGISGGRGELEALDPEDALAWDREHLARGGQHLQSRAGPQPLLDQGRALVGDVFAVVEHEERAARAEVPMDGRDRILARRLLDAERAGDDSGDEPRTRCACEVDPPRAVGEVRGGDLGDRLREARLAAAACPHEREQAGRRQEGAQGIQLPPAADEGRQRRGQVARTRPPEPAVGHRRSSVSRRRVSAGLRPLVPPLAALHPPLLTRQGDLSVASSPTGSRWQVEKLARSMRKVADRQMRGGPSSHRARGATIRDASCLPSAAAAQHGQPPWPTADHR